MKNLPGITAFKSEANIKYETDKFLCLKTNRMDKFKKWALSLGIAPICKLSVTCNVLFSIILK